MPFKGNDVFQKLKIRKICALDSEMRERIASHTGQILGFKEPTREL